MCLNLNINSNRLPKASLNHHKVLFNKNNNVLVKFYPLTMESEKGKYPSVAAKLQPVLEGFFQKAGEIFYRLRKA